MHNFNLNLKVDKINNYYYLTLPNWSRLDYQPLSGKWARAPSPQRPFREEKYPRKLLLTTLKLNDIASNIHVERRCHNALIMSGLLWVIYHKRISNLS